MPVKVKKVNFVAAAKATCSRCYFLCRSECPMDLIRICDHGKNGYFKSELHEAKEHQFICPQCLRRAVSTSPEKPICINCRISMITDHLVLY